SSREQLAALTISRRDSQLLELRKRTFGDTLNAFSECPQCGGYLEIHFTTPSIKIASDESQDVLDVKAHGLTVKLRLPNSVDLAEAISVGDIEHAREALLGRCVIEARRENMTIAADELPQEVIEEINCRMVSSDPA